MGTIVPVKQRVCFPPGKVGRKQNSPDQVRHMLELGRLDHIGSDTTHLPWINNR